MRRNFDQAAVTTSILGAVTVVTFLVPSVLTVQRAAAADGDEVQLSGVIRDFRRAHPDFDTVPPEGLGHSVDNVALTLDGRNRPVFHSGSDIHGPFENRVAHWKLDEGSGPTASDEMGTNTGTLKNDASWTADGRDGSAIHFDGTNDYVNVPSSPEMQISGDITFAGWFKLDADFNAMSPSTMVIMEKFLDTEHDFHVALTGFDYNRPEVPKGTLVFKVENGPTSDYYRYVWTNRKSWTAGTWYHFAAVLVSRDTSQNSLIIDGVDDTDPVNAGGVGFVDTDYDAPMRFGGRTIDYNGFATDIYFRGTIDDIVIFNRAIQPGEFVPSAGGYRVMPEWQDDAGNNIAPHLAVEDGAELDSCGNALDDVVGTRGSGSDGGITDAVTFNQWFRDVPGANQSVGHAITLRRGGDGVYTYIDDAFYPLDGRLFGNDGESHNNHFTYHIRATFTYDECAGHFVEFEGGDGTWIFIDRNLVIDLGGVDPAESQYVALDRLGLTDGGTYALDLFYAQRQSVNAVFRLRTTLDLSTGDFPKTVSAMFD